jgi:uncharacterized protein (DUF1684 family)
MTIEFSISAVVLRKDKNHDYTLQLTIGQGNFFFKLFTNATMDMQTCVFEQGIYVKACK